VDRTGDRAPRDPPETPLSDAQIEALRAALAASPESHPLRHLLAEQLLAAGRREDALAELRRLAEADALTPQAALVAGPLALDQGDLDLAGRCLGIARHAGLVEGVTELQARLDEARSARGVLRLVRGGADPDRADAAGAAEADREPAVTFAEIGGLDAVKQLIHRRIVLPFQRPELYEKYGRSAGGGVLLYGAPGCGKTLLARGTAGECGVPFVNVRIEQILDPYYGQSERNLHEVFEQARAKAPCVLFIDELDAIGFARRRHSGSAGRPLVDQLLQELDAIGADNARLLILAATNAPWDVDDALKRPGRFDRVLFVPPPDTPGRLAILRLLLAATPSDALDLDALAQATPLWSGADLRGLVERALDQVIEEALDSGSEPPLAQRHLDPVLRDMRPSTLDWLARARNFVEFANRAQQYREVEEFLATPEVKRWRV
jgi:transitional endoplasmic reticulum ATPase